VTVIDKGIDLPSAVVDEPVDALVGAFTPKAAVRSPSGIGNKVDCTGINYIGGDNISSLPIM
jgi:hypothetical protein